MTSVERLRELLVYDPESGALSWRSDRSNLRAGASAGTLDRKGYLRLQIDKKRYFAHRVAYAIHTGEWPSSQIDHIDGDPANNRIANLREASGHQNMWNRRKPAANTSGYKGVSFRKDLRRYQAYVAAHGKMRHIGYFDSAEEASEAYQAAAQGLHGEFFRPD